MKAQLLKKGRMVLPIFLVVALVAAGVIGLAASANAAAKGTTYTVTIASGSSATGVTSQDKGPALEIGGTLSGSFQMIVDAKGGVVIPAKTFKLSETLTGAGEGYVASMTLKKDVKAKLGSGGDASGVLNAKKATIKIGKKGPSGSLGAVLDLVTVVKDSGGKVIQKSMVYQYTFTTGNAKIAASGTKNGFDGKSLSGAGAVLDLSAGKGKMVGIAGFMNGKSSIAGVKLIDYMGIQTWTLAIK